MPLTLCPRLNRTMLKLRRNALAQFLLARGFHYCLYGRGNVTAETDLKALIAVFYKTLLSVPKELHSMLLTLQNYSLKDVCRPGPDMHITDTLSRVNVLQNHAMSSAHATAGTG